jgi:hypothetical protein
MERYRIKPIVRVYNTSCHRYLYICFLSLDIPEVVATERPPCRPEQVCPTLSFPQTPDADFDAPFSSSLLSSATLIDCDSGSASCVCQRGYELVGGSCVGEFVSMAWQLYDNYMAWVVVRFNVLATRFRSGSQRTIRSLWSLTNRILSRFVLRDTWIGWHSAVDGVERYRI